jgi:hypothetical protein
VTEPAAGTFEGPGIIPVPEAGLRIIVPGRPETWNHAYKRSRHTGKPVLTEDARLWKEAVYLTSLNAFNRSRWRPTGRRIAVHIWLYLSTDMDADNSLKLTLDGLARGIGVNDKLFLPRVMAKEVGIARERIEFYLTNEE